MCLSAQLHVHCTGHNLAPPINSLCAVQITMLANQADNILISVDTAAKKTAIRFTHLMKNSFAITPTVIIE